MNKLAIITIAFTVLLSTLPAAVLFRAAAQTTGAAQEPIQAGHTHDIIEVKWSPDDERLISYSAGDGGLQSGWKISRFIRAWRG